MVSFIIPAHNEELLIAGTLRALHSAAGAMNEPYEIVVVDDASTDGTKAVASNCGAYVQPVQYRNISAARNAGAAYARGDRLMFVDADTSVNAAVVLAAVHAIRAGAVGGGAKAQFDGRVPLYGRILARLWQCLQRFGHLASGCFIFCTREAFEAAGRFDETLYAAEDVVLSKQLRRLGRFVILRESVVTSGRSIRSNSAFEMFRIASGFALRGPDFFRTRCGPWYAERRDDPDLTAD